MTAILRSESELIQAATRAYFRRNGENANQPSIDSSEVVGDLVELNNINGNLATYRISRAGTLRFVA